MTTVLALLREAVAAGVRLSLEGGRLRVRAPEGALTPQLRAAIAAHRDALIALLAEDDGRVETPIAPRPQQDTAPLSSGQRRLWLLHQLTPDSTIFNISVGWKLEGDLDVSALQFAVDAVVARHQVLRTTFVDGGDGPVQRIAAPATVPVRQLDAHDFGEVMAADMKRPFDLAADLPVRITLARRGARQFALIVTMHHIVSDHASILIFTRELSAAYRAKVAGVPLNLPPLPFQFGDYAVVERQERDRSPSGAHADYWRRQLDGAPKLLELPTDRPRPAVSSSDGRAFTFHVVAERASPLIAAGAQHGLTPYMTLLGAYALLLARYSGQADVCIGGPVSARRAGGSDHVIGFFVDTQVLRIDTGGEPSVAEFFERVRRAAVDALAHPLPFDRLVDAVGAERSMSHTPIFQAMLVLQAEGLPALDLPGVTDRQFAPPITSAEFDITLFLAQQGQALTGHVEFRADLFDVATIEQMCRHFGEIVDFLALDTSVRLDRLALSAGSSATAAETHAFVSAVHEQVSARSAAQPSAPALSGDNGVISYAELDRRIDQLAWHLVEAGVSPGDRVAVRVDSTRDFTIAALGIMRAGCAYVPIASGVPAHRAQRIIDTNQIALIVDAERLAASAAQPRPAAPPRPAKPDDIAAVYHTSGTTGVPMGVLFTHGGLASHADAVRERYALTNTDRVLQFAAWDFDVAAEEVFPTLCAGGTIVERPDPDLAFAEFEAHVARHGATVLNLPASFWEAWVNHDQQAGQRALDRVRLLIVGSERVTSAAMAKWFGGIGRGIRTLNAYGTTEATITTTVLEVTPAMAQSGAVVPVGTPLRYSSVYVLDAQGRRLPSRVSGEIWIGGAGVSPGYVGAPDATAARFAPDPFSPHAEAQMMRTGDRGRWLADGSLEVIGRMDRQIKLRGFRIDPRDIEAALTAHPAVEQCAVILARRPGAPDRLVGYASLVAGIRATADELREFVATQLPAYMVPAAIVTLDALPLTPRGKVDLAALEARPLESEGAVVATAPRTSAETILAAIWAELLGVGSISITDNFFALGGDSILGIAMVSRARARGLQLKPHSLLEHQTIETLARSATSASLAAPAAPVSGPVPLSPMQRRFFAERPEGRSRYNQAVRVTLPADVDTDALQRAMQAVVDHHAALRFRFENAEDGWRQIAGGAPVINLDSVVHESDAATHDADVVAALEDRLDIGAGKLVQVCLVSAPQSRALLIVIHHLVVDAVSFSIVLDDLERAYRQMVSGMAIALPDPTIPFAAFAQRVVAAPVGAQDASAWLEQLDDPAAWCSEADATGPAIAIETTLDAASTDALLRWMPALFNAATPDALIAAVAQGAQTAFGTDRLRLDIEGHGRDVPLDDLDVSRTVGWFTTIHPLLTYAAPGTATADRVARIRDTRRDLPPAYTYDVARFAVTDARAQARLDDAGNAPVLFNYLGVWRRDDADASWTARPVTSANQADAHRSHAVEINAVVSSGQLRVHWTCGERLAPAIGEWSRAVVSALEALAADCVRWSANLGGNIEAVLPLTPLQLGLLSHTLRDAGGLSYLDLLTLTIDGDLDAALFRQAWEMVVDRHASLRTSLAYRDVPLPLQVIRRRVDLDWQVEDARGDGDAARARRLDALRRSERETALDLTRAPLMRFRLVRVDDRQHVLFWTTSHVILDGWSTGIVFNELFAIYGALRQGRQPHLPAAASFAQFVRAMDRSARDAEAYWRVELKNLSAPTPIPLGRHAADERDASTSHHVRRISLDEPISARLRALARESQVSLSILFQAAWALINRREHDQQTVTFGLTVSGRSGEIEGIESMVGTLINAVPAVITVADDLPVREWLRQLHAQHLSRERFSNVGLPTLQRWSSIPAGTELFESLLILQNYPGGNIAAESGLRINSIAVDEATHYPLSVVVEPGDRIGLGISYRPDRLTDQAAAQLLQQLTSVLHGMLDAPDHAVRSISLMSAHERRLLLEDWSSSGEIKVEPAVFVRQFEAQAARTPDAIALEHGDRRWSYAELDAEANRWAHGLIAFGCGPGAIVGVSLERSPEHILAVLAIFKSGGAFLPLDPAHPSARLDMMINDAGVALLITTSGILNNLPAQALLTICVDEQPPGDGQPDSNPGEALEPDALAYVIYTSGSTGSPKGVMGLHRGLGSLAANQRQLFALGTADRVLQFAPIGFDASLWEMAMALGSGATLVLAAREALMPGPPLERLLRDGRITTVTLPPSSLAALEPGAFPALHTLIVAGESCAPSLARTWARDRRMFNAYGPTETAVCATIGRCGDSDEAPAIGRPLANFRVHLLDADLQPVAPGAMGEICVAGWGLAGGYLGREQLTRDKFVINPHAGVAYPAAGYERLYRTGDLGRYRSDGAIEFIGRRDGQVKVRGFRIELGEIEAALSEHRRLRQCCVIAREDADGGKHLVAYTVPREDAPPVDELRAFLKERLPDYMVPAQFVSLSELPVTANGKIARLLLPAPGTASLGMDERYAAPRNQTEAALAGIWASVLRLPRVGIHDNFFEIGGDSILAIQVVSRGSQAGVAVTLADLFDQRYQTIAALSERVIAGPTAQAEPDAATGPFGLTPIQHWFFAQHMPARHHYNQTLLFEVPADLDRRALDAALGSLRRHHDALRLRFVETADGWRQEIVADHGRAVLDIVRLEGTTPAERRCAIEAEAARQQALFDLAGGHVFRAVLLTFDDRESQRLWLSAHHLVIDGVSWNILLEDLVNAYAAINAGDSPAFMPKTRSYRGWSEDLQTYADSADLALELPYWHRVESQTAAVAIDRGDRRRNPAASARRFTATVGVELSNAVLRDVPRVYQTQINDVLLTAVAWAFRERIGQSQLTINLEGHGREPVNGINVTRTVGWFTSIFPVTLAADAADIGTLLLATMESLRSVPQRGIGYGVLRYLKRDSGLGSGTAPDVSFNYLGQAGQIEAPADWLRMAAETVAGDFSSLGTRPHLIDINAIHLNEQLQFDWIYNDELHDESTIRGLAGAVEDALRAIVEHCRTAGARLPVTSMQEQILRHAATQPQSPAYRVELACHLTGRLDVDRFRTCWQHAVDRHPALRAVFSRVSDRTVRQHFAEHLPLRWDGAEGPAFGGPLVSAWLEPTGEQAHRFAFRHHHLLLDGWSVPALIGEVLAEYEGRHIEPPAGSLEAYLQWLARRDASTDRAFWRSELAGFAGPATPPAVEGPAASESISLGAELSDALRTFAASRHLTLNTVLFGAWAVTLASLRESTDVAVGTVFSGRNAPVAGIDRLVGMLINTLPVRVTIDAGRSVDAWLAGLQRRLAAAMEHSAVRLSDIESECGLTNGSFDTTFRFQNYPVDPEALSSAGGLTVSDVTIRDVWHYPLNVSVIPGDDIRVIADYFPSAHRPDAIALALAVFSGVAGQIAADGAIDLAALLDPQFGGVLD